MFFFYQIESYWCRHKACTGWRWHVARPSNRSI